MLRNRTKAQNIGVIWVLSSVIMAPFVYSTFAETRQFCNDLYPRTDTMECVFTGPVAAVILPLSILMVLFFVVGVMLLLAPVIKRRF